MLIKKALTIRNPIRLKGVFKIFANAINLLSVEGNLFSMICDLAISSFECDYFLLKVEFFKNFIVQDLLNFLDFLFCA